MGPGDPEIYEDEDEEEGDDEILDDRQLEEKTQNENFFWEDWLDDEEDA